MMCMQYAIILYLYKWSWLTCTHLPWKSNVVYQSIIIHLLEEVQSSLVLAITLLVMQHIESDQGREQPHKHQGVEQSIA